MTDDEEIENTEEEEGKGSKNPLIEIKGNEFHFLKLDGKFTESALKLFDRFSNFLGVYPDPQRRVEVAKAEVEAELIRADGKVQLTERQKRGLHRTAIQEGINQENIDNILLKASSQLNDDSKPEEMDDDWVFNYIDKAKLISDNEMQSLWAKLLAGETNQPGTFSKRTVNLINDLDKEGAELFTKLCSFMVYPPIVNPIDYIPVVYDLKEKLYLDNGINFGTLSHLDFMGLIKFDHLSSFNLTFTTPTLFLVYFQKAKLLQLKPDNKFIFGGIKLTQAGKELAPIAKGVEVDGFHDYLIKKWNGFGYTIPNPK